MFSHRQGLLAKAGVILAIVWVLVWAGLKIARSMTPTPEKVAEYVDNHPLDGIEDPDERLKVIGRVADMLNQLPPEEFGRLAEDENRGNLRRDFFEGMSDEEQRFFMEKRIGKAFDQMMQAFNEMDRDERKRIVERTLKDMRRDGQRRDGLERMEETDPEMADKIINEGLRSYYQEANAETKLDLAPVLEQMQINLGAGGGRRR